MDGTGFENWEQCAIFAKLRYPHLGEVLSSDAPAVWKGPQFHVANSGMKANTFIHSLSRRFRLTAGH